MSPEEMDNNLKVLAAAITKEEICPIIVLPYGHDLEVG